MLDFQLIEPTSSILIPNTVDDGVKHEGLEWVGNTRLAGITHAYTGNYRSRPDQATSERPVNYKAVIRPSSIDYIYFLG